MTLNDIIVASLAQLDRGHDAQTLDVWRDKLTRFANDGMADLALSIKPRRTENVSCTGTGIDTSALSHRCVRICALERAGKPIAFEAGRGVGLVRTPGAAPGDALTITYVYIPDELSASTDVPELPEICHPLIVDYVIGRERASGESSSQRGGNIYFQMYEAGKRMLRTHLGENGAFCFTNRW